MEYLEKTWHFAELVWGPVHGFHLEGKVSGSCMN